MPTTKGILSTVTDRIARIVRNLLRHVPDPPKPIARPAASFAGLKVRQRLQSVQADIAKIPWEVLAVDSQGATIAVVGTKAPVHRIESREWAAVWSRVRAPRKPRNATKEPK